MREWVKVRPRNEALDLEVYALAAVNIYLGAGRRLTQRLEERSREWASGEAAPPVAQGPPVRIQLPPSRWVYGWKDRWR